ncbi:hypothetical protein HS3_01533 [Bacillus subtilis]|uniref:Uncharacterized protein n=1 Tax=Bacillus subtilis subsp. subtilis TaxID=135461 RepID=A0ABD3ZVK8_BACIU|nr:hypothetical protein B4067_4502 [Bacillus subtilis subsp. subtilis]KIN26668.1 hypothetical protein B4069_4190 [Bacillus subtilis]KIN40276.1 hypothetical protein B4070_4082 [Bacillus subtilis]KIN59087.1 hypothetical protein B4145_4328 [Bacillus subtilis]RAP07609.1 hypothetical protein HS3_01533 [Bacillus subtilis]
MMAKTGIVPMINMKNSYWASDMCVPAASMSGNTMKVLMKIIMKENIAIINTSIIEAAARIQNPAGFSMYHFTPLKFSGYYTLGAAGFQ